MPDPIIRGNTLRADLSVRDDFNVLADPLTLLLTIKTPGNVTTILTYPTAAIVRVSLGIYYSDIVLTEIGVWEYEWSTTSPVRAEGEQIYVEANPLNSAPSIASVVDYTRLYLGGENWNVLVNTNSVNFGISFVILGIEAVKRRVLANPPAPSGESDLNPNVLAYLGILSALELITACRDAWASKIISRSAGADPTEVTTYTDRSKMITDLRDDLLAKIAELRKAALPYLDDDAPAYSMSSPGIDEIDDYKVTEDPRCFPPASTFPYARDEVLPWR